MSPVGEHCAVEIDAMKCTKLNEPSNVVDVLRWNDCKCQKNCLAVAKFGADASHLPVALRTVEMIEVDEQNRNVHAVPQACNWQANEQPVEMWRKARFGLCALQSYGNRVKVLVATAVVPNELAKEIRELMVTTLNVCNVELHQKVESLCSVITGGQLVFLELLVSTVEEHKALFETMRQEVASEEGEGDARRRSRWGRRRWRTRKRQCGC